jgi:hypothetical protein
LRESVEQDTTQQGKGRDRGNNRRGPSGVILQNEDDAPKKAPRGQ